MKALNIKDFAYTGSVINSNGDCSQEPKRRLRQQKGANGRIRKDHQEQTCVTGEHPRPRTPNYYVQM